MHASSRKSWILSKPSFLHVALCLAAVLFSSPSAAQSIGDSPSFVAFESGPVRPLALSPSGDRLFVVNTPDARLEIFQVDDTGLTHLASVSVGLEPVAVAARSDGEVWVVNQVSDSVSIVDVSGTFDGSAPPQVVRTLLVGDEPRDIVFAGAARDRAFITSAHRGQHRVDPSIADVPGAGDPQMTTPGVGRADVWVFDAEAPGRGAGETEAFGGKPLAILTLFGDTPRALAVTPDGATVYAAIFKSGNATTTIPEQAVCDGFDPATPCPGEFPGAPGGLPGPADNAEGDPAPEVGLIAKQDPATGAWRDVLGRDWSAAVRFDLPDLDVFAIDAASLETVEAFPGVGTVLFNMAVNPVSGAVYVTNTEARNLTRFEGPGEHGGSTVQGRLHEARVTVLRRAEEGGASSVRPRHLNKHIDYALRPAPSRFKKHSLATPLGMAITADGSTLYVAAFGSSKIGVFPTAALEDDSFDPTVLSSGYLDVGGGPSGLLLDETRGRLYVATRFDNAVAALDLASGETIDRVELFNPEPPEVVEGRPLLYDARITSSNGEASCASCHIFADLDEVAWNLGDPDGQVTSSPISIFRADDSLAASPPINGTGNPEDFHPMKGPMVTQTLRGLQGTGALHWRGDRSNGFFGQSPSDTDLAFRNFIVAFPGLVGRRGMISEAKMGKFADFILRLMLPPNPVRSLDNALDDEQQKGFVIFDKRLAAAGGLGDRRCRSCHSLDGQSGHFGTGAKQAFVQGQSQILKVPHLRTLYSKVGMFGMAATDFVRPGGNGHRGPQVRGYGYTHDGSVDTIFRFLRAFTFNDDPGGVTGFVDDAERRQVEKYLHAFENDLAPIVGQQVTLGASSPAAARTRADLLLERAGSRYASVRMGDSPPECDLVAHAVVDGAARGFLYDSAGRVFLPDRATEPPLALDALAQRTLADGGGLTLTCLPPGSGERGGLDRDEDGFYDRDELDAGTDPGDPLSAPGSAAIVVEPIKQTFGNVAVGGESFRNMTVENRGVGVLEIEEIRLAGDDRARWELVAGRDGCTGLRIPAGQSCTFRARFAPHEVRRLRASAVILSSDPETPKLRVLLRGTGTMP